MSKPFQSTNAGSANGDQASNKYKFPRYRLNRAFRRLPPAIRQHCFMSPDFVIIGAQKCGTSSLYKYLAQHPLVVNASTKEIHYFDISFRKGICWYKQQFPTLFEKAYARFLLKRPILTGEGSPYYIFHPHAPGRMRAAIPQAKLIVLLRNPVDRAYSHYQHSKRTGYEPLSFGEAISREAERLASELERLTSDQDYYSQNHQVFTYLSRGIYVDQLKVWFDLFPPKQILILCSEEFYADPQRSYRQVLEFLGLPDWELQDLRRYNDGGHYPEMESSIRMQLNDYFAPHNQRLFEFLGAQFNWEKEPAGGYGHW